MPYNHTKLEQRLSDCDQRLEALFADKELGIKIKQQIQAVQNYYNLSYTKATSAKTVESIATSYKYFVDVLEDVTKGKVQRNDAVESLLKTSQSRKLNLLGQNLVKACEFLFWSATAISLYAGIFGLALPVLIIQPILGVAVTTTIVGAMLASAYKALSCLTEFKSLSRHDKEHTNEVDLVSFFQPAPSRLEIPSPMDEQEQAFCF